MATDQKAGGSNPLTHMIVDCGAMDFAPQFLQLHSQKSILAETVVTVQPYFFELAIELVNAFLLFCSLP